MSIGTTSTTASSIRMTVPVKMSKTKSNSENMINQNSQDIGPSKLSTIDHTKELNESRFGVYC